jgi:glycerate dehydrogenase
MMKAAFLDSATLGETSLDEWNKYVELSCYESTSMDQTIERLQSIDIAITNKVVINREIMDATNLKAIYITATGTNNVDLEYAKEKGIEVKNVAGYAVHSVVQQTLAMVLHHNQSLNGYHQFIKSGKWKESGMFTSHIYPYDELSTKKWGIIGLGNIGLEMAKVASSLGCHVMYYSTSGKNNIKMFDRVDSLEELMASCDIISIHCALNENTVELINKCSLQHVKDNAILVNMARGGVVNEADLVDKFNSSNIKIGLDVMVEEPMLNSPLMSIVESDRALFTPHNAWASISARKKIVETITEYLKQ